MLILHPETEYFAGAEKVLQYFLKGQATLEDSIAVALAPGSKVDQGIPPAMRRVALVEMPKLSPLGLLSQVRAVARFHQEYPFDLVHAWAARSWELASLAGKLLRVPAIGTLHDHPAALFISGKRQWLMRTCARRGLQRVVAVSEAVRRACIMRGYPPQKMAVIHNGLPDFPPPRPRTPGNMLQLGYIGALTERKGLRGLFQVCEELARRETPPWILSIAGEAQDEPGRQLVAELRRHYQSAPWWRRIHWLGWVDNPGEFLPALDCLLFTSSDFDPFPTVILEAGFMGVPVLGTRVGGVPEMILPNQTGWLYEPGDWPGAAAKLAGLLAEPNVLAQAGQAARHHVRQHFTLDKMVAEYRAIYTNLSPS